MMIMRNNEVHRAFALQCIVAVTATVLTALLDIKYGLITLAVCALLIIIYVVSVKKRYKLFSELALDIDRILHSDNDIMLEKYDEGELAILQNELYKMVSRLRQQQQTLQNDKIYLSDSIADISHQLRTPLTSINLLLSMLSEPDLTERKKAEIIHKLYEMLSRTDWLITTLLKISRLDTGTVEFRRESIPLAELIKKSCSPLNIPIEIREQKLIINADGDFSGDISWTCEAIGNIVKNCMEHTNSGGTITINAIGNPLYTEIVISDTGDGIAEKDLPHIFERFYKGDDSDENSFGIGLALARMIITKQNGTIKAENKKGAVFTIRFYKVTV
ncbi:MAG: HAMP domain-containing histidine kinase [Ruminococcus flavefaciens]|nr:HAMP domain-containing histidine kinase [Ruminococcus flavefaciens]